MSIQVCQELSLNYTNVVQPQVREITATVNGLISTAKSSTNIEELKSTKSKLQAQLDVLANYYESYTITQEEAEKNGCQAVALDYARSASDINSLAFDTDSEAQNLYFKINDLEKQKIETTNNPQDPATAQDPADSGSQNQVNDDAGGTAVSGENQKSSVVPESGVPTSVSAAGKGQGTQASPGPSGTRGADELPGRRTYNPLSKLASYTYNFTLYQITPDAYEAFIASGKKKIDALSTAAPVGQTAPGSGAGAFVIAQSGGINNKTQTRAPGFELDYYIDDVQYTVATNSMETTVPAFVSQLKMTITEPYGFSFLSNLKRTLNALQEYSNSTSFKNMENSIRMFFILGIRFYGYDANGNLIKGTDILDGEALDPGNNTENLFESFYDLQVISIKFQLNGKGGTTYNLEFANPAGQTLMGVKRGRIKTGARCVGSTVEDMLTGPDGLLTKMNKDQEDQAKKNPPDRKIANKFKVKFIGEAEQRIKTESMVLQSDLNKWRWPGSSASSTSGVNDNTGIKEVPNSNARELIFNSDTSVIQAISNIITKSRFMEKALKAVYSNVVQPDPKQKNVEQVTNNEPTQLSWFNISAEISDLEWDTQIQDWAYTTTYIITLYDIPAVNTPYSDLSAKYYGPHKYYNYWLTGLNTEVLDFSLTFNNAYNQVLLATIPGTANVSPATGTNYGQTAIDPGARTGGDTSGSLNTAGEAQASVVTSLIDAEAFSKGKISILGDPDFLIRDQVTSVNELYRKFYDTNGFTISAAGGTVFVEVILKESQDYKHSIGLQEINESIQFYPYPKSVQAIAKGIIYQVNTCVARFSQGKFTMELDLNGATAWPSDPPESTPTGGAGRESQASASEGAGTKSGASTGAGQSTSANTGQRQDPPLPTQVTPGPQVSAGNTDTVGSPSPQTVTTDTGVVADDDSQLTPVTITATKRTINDYNERVDFDGTTWYDSNGNPLPGPPGF
jgi:hypothetical protein